MSVIDNQYHRLDGETDDELIFRITSDKDKIGTWSDVASILNKLLKSNYSESKYRKTRKAFDKMLEASRSCNYLSNDSQLEEIELAKRELERKKIQFRDERRAWNKQNYTDARFQEVMDLLDERFDDFGRIYFKNHEKPIAMGDDAMIVCLSDLHIGQTFNSAFGEYDSDIAKERLEKYLNEIISIGKLHKVSKVYVLLLGDSISGSLHKTIEVSNKENVVDQLKLSIEYLTSFCYELTEQFTDVYLASASGNHSRLQAKDLAQHSERLDAFIAWDVCRVLEHLDNFHSLLHRNIDDGIADVNILGKSYLMVHGDFDNATKQGYMNLSAMCGFFPENIFSGHKHFCMYSQESKFIQSGSLSGSGCDYTIEKRLVGKPSQMVCIATKDGIKNMYPVIL